MTPQDEGSSAITLLIDGITVDPTICILTDARGAIHRGVRALSLLLRVISRSSYVDIPQFEHGALSFNVRSDTCAFDIDAFDSALKQLAAYIDSGGANALQRNPQLTDDEIRLFAQIAKDLADAGTVNIGVRGRAAVTLRFKRASPIARNVRFVDALALESMTEVQAHMGKFLIPSDEARDLHLGDSLEDEHIRSRTAIACASARVISIQEDSQLDMFEASRPDHE